MKKLLIAILVFFSVFAPVVQAEETTYKTLNFKEVLEEEQITADIGDYQESDDQIPIYLFRGKGCFFCRSFITFLTTIVKDYGNYFKLVSYEVWNDTTNKNLMTEVANFLNEPANGVPYIVIGDKVFGGYTASYDEEIKSAIMTLYKSDDRYDVFEEMKKAEKNTNSTSDHSVIWWMLFFFVLSTGSVLIYLHYETKKIMDYTKEQISILQKSMEKGKEVSNKKTQKTVR